MSKRQIIITVESDRSAEDFGVSVGIDPLIPIEMLSIAAAQLGSMVAALMGPPYTGRVKFLCKEMRILGLDEEFLSKFKETRDQLLGQ